MQISHNQIVSSDDQDFLISLRDTHTTIEWAVGDKANEIYEHPSIVGVTRQQVYAAVGYYFGKPARTVRYYAETAKHISEEMREEYHNLPFGMFALAVRPQFRDAQQTREILEWASLNNASIDQTEYRFGVKEDDEQGYTDSLQNVKITTISYRDSDDLKDAFQSIIDDFLGKEVPPEVRTRASWHINALFSEIEQSKVKVRYPKIGSGIDFKRDAQ